MTQSRREEGFTLIELMMVVLIIGILIAIALPTFLGARTRAQNRATQSNLRTALAAALTYYSDGDTFTGFGVVQAEAVDSSLTWAAAGVPTGDQIGIQVAGGGNLVLTSLSASQTFWCLEQLPNSPATQRGGDTNHANVDGIGECTQGWS